MELQKEIEPLRLEHNRKMQHQDREREDSQCDAEQAVTQHFEESLRRANHPGWSQPQPLHPKPMPIFQPSPSSLPPVVPHHSASSSGGGASNQSSSYNNANDQQVHPSQGDPHQPRNNFVANPISDRDPILHERKPPPNHVQPLIHHSHNKSFDHQRHHEQQQHIYMKPMPQDTKHDQVSADDSRKLMGRGVSTKEQMIIQQQPYMKSMKSTPLPPKSQPGLRRETSFRPNPINVRDVMMMQQQDYMLRNSDPVLVHQTSSQLHHQRRINEIPVEMQQSSTVGVIVKRDMHPQHQPMLQQPQQSTPHSGPSYGNKRNSTFGPLQVSAIHKPTPQSHSPSGRVMYEYRQVTMPMGGPSTLDPNSQAAHLMYQSISPHQAQQHPAKSISISGGLNPSSNPPLMVHPSSRHPNIASPPISKSKVSAPAPPHIYGKPIELNAPGICSGIPVCQSRRESPSKTTYTSSPIGVNASPLSSSSTLIPAPPPAHLGRPTDVRHYSSRLPMHASSPPPTGPQSPSPSLLVQKTTTISPLTSPMLHGQSIPNHHHSALITSSVRPGPSSPSSFQTQPLDLGVSNRVDHHYNPKRKASHVLSASTEALDIRKKRTQPSPPAHHLHVDSSVMFAGGRMSPTAATASYRPSNLPTEIRRSIAGPPHPAASNVAGHYDAIPVAAQTVYVPSMFVADNRHNYPKTGEMDDAPKALIASNSVPESTTTTVNTLPTRFNYSNNNNSSNSNNKSNKNIEANAQLPMPATGRTAVYSPTPLTTISKAHPGTKTTAEVPVAQPVAPEHDKPVVNQSAPPRHLKKAWLQRHTGEDSESNNDKIIVASTKLPSISSPSAISVTTPSPAPSATPTPPPTTPTTATHYQMPPTVANNSQAPLVHSSSSTTSSLSSPSTTSSTPPPHLSPVPAAAANNSVPPQLSTTTNNNKNNTANHASTPPPSVVTARNS